MNQTELFKARLNSFLASFERELNNVTVCEGAGKTLAKLRKKLASVQKEVGEVTSENCPMPDCGGPYFSAVMAIAKNRVIGTEDGLPWSLPEDMAFFKKLTTGHTVVMGRKTWETLPGSLKGRRNIVLTTRTKQELMDEAESAGKQVDWNIVEVVNRVGVLEDELYEGEKVFVIGGADVYKQLLPRCSEVYVTYVKMEYKGTVFMPPFEEGYEIAETINRSGLMDIVKLVPKISRGNANVSVEKSGLRTVRQIVMQRVASARDSLLRLFDDGDDQVRIIRNDMDVLIAKIGQLPDSVIASRGDRLMSAAEEDVLQLLYESFVAHRTLPALHEDREEVPRLFRKIQQAVASRPVRRELSSTILS